MQSFRAADHDSGSLGFTMKFPEQPLCRTEILKATFKLRTIDVGVDLNTATEEVGVNIRVLADVENVSLCVGNGSCDGGNQAG